jgi:hypothetical protein
MGGSKRMMDFSAYVITLMSFFFIRRVHASESAPYIDAFSVLSAMPWQTL